MYAPSSASFLTAMQQQIRPMDKMAMRILQINPVSQQSMVVTASGCDPLFSGNYYRISQITTDTDAYLITQRYIYRSALSSGSTAGTHGYAFATAPQIGVTISATCDYVTLVWDRGYPPCHITVTLSGGTQASTTDYYLDYVDHLTIEPGDATTITYTIRSMQMPGVSLSIYHAFAGTFCDVPSDDILSIDYHDINDGVGLELPQITAKIVTRNDGAFDRITEMSNPTFSKYDTQCILQYGLQLTGGYEYVPLPKLFLDGYKVGIETVTWTFVGASTVANDGLFLWSRLSANMPYGYRVSSVFSDIFTHQLSYLDPNGDLILSPYRRYNMHCIASSINNSNVDMVMPLPLVSAAQALQLLCLYTRNCVLLKRGQYDVVVNPILYNTAVCGDLTDDQCYGKPDWTADNAADVITVRQYSYSATNTQKTVVENAHVSASGVSVIYYDDIVIAGTVSSLSGTSITQKTGFSHYPHCVYLQAASDVDDVVISAQIRPITKQDIPCRCGPGSDTIVVDNPLQYARQNVLTAQYLANTVFSVLQHRVLGTVDHRGRPDLDAGDVVTVSTSSGAPGTALIVENSWTLSAGGEMSGKTIFRLL